MNYLITNRPSYWSERSDCWGARENATEYGDVADLPHTIPAGNGPWLAGEVEPELELWHDQDLADAKYYARTSMIASAGMVEL